MKSRQYKIIHFRFLLLVVLVNCLFSAQLFASNPSSLDKQISALQVDVPRIREIMQLVFRNKDQPTKQIHDEFWGLILTRIHADPKELQKGFTEGGDSALVIQLAFWNSVRLSAQSHRVIVTKEFAELRKTVPAAAYTEDYITRQNAMLSAAATGNAYVSRSGEQSIVTESAAVKIIASLKDIKSRIHKLCDPNW